MYIFGPVPSDDTDLHTHACGIAGLGEVGGQAKAAIATASCIDHGPPSTVVLPNQGSKLTLFQVPWSLMCHLPRLDYTSTPCRNVLMQVLDSRM